MKEEIIDLTLEVKEGMLTFPAHWHPKVEIKRLGSIGAEGRQTHRIVLGTHTGTHIDAPAHFIRNGRCINELSLMDLIGDAKVADLSGVRSRQITAKDLSVRCRRSSGIKRLLIYTGWSKQWGKKDYYVGYPYLGSDACDWIIDNSVRVLGMDVPSPDNPADNRISGNDSPNHYKLLKNGVILIEYLTSLEKLLGKKVKLVALPLRLKGCDGSPARVAAIIR